MKPVVVNKRTRAVVVKKRRTREYGRGVASPDEVSDFNGRGSCESYKGIKKVSLALSSGETQYLLTQIGVYAEMLYFYTKKANADALKRNVTVLRKTDDALWVGPIDAAR